MSIIEKALRKKGGEKSPDERSVDDARDRSALERGEDFVDGDVAASQAKALRTRSGSEAEALATAPLRGSEISASLPADADESPDKSNASSYIELPFASLVELGFLSPATPRSRMAEEFRTIKRPLLRNINGGGSSKLERPNLIMVTSALQGDGKTFSSINLAISIAMEQDKTVLFVDADVVRATAGRTLGVSPGTPGLIDLLQDGSSVEPSDVIMRTNMDKLRILPAGNPSDKATELLASSDMHDFMIELSNRYPDRVIVFDSPPLLLTTEAAVLASFMGQIVFVASADITPQHAVQEALEQIGEDKMVGVVLNRASRRRSKLFGIGSYGYGYGYGQGYGYGADREESPGAGERVDT